MNNTDLKFEKMKQLSRKMVLLPGVAMAMAMVVFILEGFPYPGRTSFAHGILSERLAPGLVVFDIMHLFVLFLFIVTLIPLAFLLTDRGLRNIHLAVRLTVVFQFVLYAWIVFFASRLMLSSYFGVLYMPEVLIRNFIFGGLLLAAYYYFKKRYVEKPETMFP